MRSALMIEGELPEDGLATLEGDGTDLMLALARRLTQEASGEGGSLEALFAQTREHELEAEDYLIDGEWENVATNASAAFGHGPPDGEAAELWQHVFAGDEMEIEGPAEVGSLASAGGRILSLEELARLVQRPKPRRRPVPEAQLTLFAA